MTHVYLRHENPAGSGDGVELYPGKSYFLPNNAPSAQSIDVVEAMDGSHSGTKLGIYEQDVLISAYGSKRTEVLEGAGGGRYKVPISPFTEERQICMVLRKGDQILTPSGRWSLVWRTGESQISVLDQAFHSDGARSFDASLEVDDSQSQDNESSISHDAAYNFIISNQDNEYGTHLLASVFMPPPPLPRVDIVLDATDPLDNGVEAEFSIAIDVDVQKPGRNVEEKSRVASNTPPTSQGIRTALAELNINKVGMLRKYASESPRTPPELHHGLFRDENGNIQNPKDSTAAPIQQTDDINLRRVLQNDKKSDDEDVTYDRRGLEEHEEIARSVDGHEDEDIVKLLDIDASTMIGQEDATEPHEALQAEIMIAVLEHHIDTYVTNPSTHIDGEIDHESELSTTETDSRRCLDAKQMTEDEQARVSPEMPTQSSNPLPAQDQTTMQETTTPCLSSGSSRKRKATIYSRKESPISKRSKENPEEGHSYRNNGETETIAVEPILRSMRTITANYKRSTPSPRRTTQTLKPTPKLTPPASSITSTRPGSGRKHQVVMTDSTPSRSRSSSIASSSHFAEYLGSPPKALFTSTTTVDRKRDTMRDFAKLGGEQVDSIDQANMLIVGGPNLKKTAKLILAVARGMDVVNERWIVESRRKDVLLDIIPFLAEDEAHETEWGSTLIEATARGKEGIVQELLHDTTVHTTKDLDKGAVARDLPSIVKALGGNIVKGSLPSPNSRTKNVLVLGTPHDPQAVQVQRTGCKLFDKDLIILGALRGEIDTESSEFEIGVPIKEEEESQ